MPVVPNQFRTLAGASSYFCVVSMAVYSLIGSSESAPGKTFKPWLDASGQALGRRIGIVTVDIPSSHNHDGLAWTMWKFDWESKTVEQSGNLLSSFRRIDG